MVTDLLLIPGLMCDRTLWEPQIAALEGRIRCEVADPTSHEKMSEMAEAILEAAPPRFALAGLSMGGFLALELALRAPHRVERLALLNARGEADTPEARALRLEAVALAEDGCFDEVIERYLTHFVHPDRLEDEALCDVLRNMMARAGPETMIRQQRALMGRRDLSGLLGRIKVPALVLCGRQDVLTPLAHSERLASRIEGAELVVVEDCGHISTLERPEAVNRALERWLALDEDTARAGIDDLEEDETADLSA